MISKHLPLPTLNRTRKDKKIDTIPEMMKMVEVEFTGTPSKNNTYNSTSITVPTAIKASPIVNITNIKKQSKQLANLRQPFIFQLLNRVHSVNLNGFRINQSKVYTILTLVFKAAICIFKLFAIACTPKLI